MAPAAPACSSCCHAAAARPQRLGGACEPACSKTWTRSSLLAAILRADDAYVEEFLRTSPQLADEVHDVKPYTGLSLYGPALGDPSADRYTCTPLWLAVRRFVDQAYGGLWASLAANAEGAPRKASARRQAAAAGAPSLVKQHAPAYCGLDAASLDRDLPRLLRIVALLLAAGADPARPGPPVDPDVGPCCGRRVRMSPVELAYFYSAHGPVAATYCTERGFWGAARDHPRSFWAALAESEERRARLVSVLLGGAGRPLSISVPRARVLTTCLSVCNGFAGGSPLSGGPLAGAIASGSPALVRATLAAYASSYAAGPADWSGPVCTCGLACGCGRRVPPLSQLLGVFEASVHLIPEHARGPASRRALEAVEAALDAGIDPVLADPNPAGAGTGAYCGPRAAAARSQGSEIRLRGGRDGGLSALDLACRLCDAYGDARPLAALLARRPDLERRNGYGCTPLQQAACWGSCFEVVDALLAAGASLCAEAGPVSPLHSMDGAARTLPELALANAPRLCLETPLNGKTRDAVRCVRGLCERLAMEAGCGAAVRRPVLDFCLRRLRSAAAASGAAGDGVAIAALADDLARLWGPRAVDVEPAGAGAECGPLPGPSGTCPEAPGACETCRAQAREASEQQREERKRALAQRRRDSAERALRAALASGDPDRVEPALAAARQARPPPAPGRAGPAALRAADFGERRRGPGGGRPGRPRLPPAAPGPRPAALRAVREAASQAPLDPAADRRFEAALRGAREAGAKEAELEAAAAERARAAEALLPDPDPARLARLRARCALAAALREARAAACPASLWAALAAARAAGADAELDTAEAERALAGALEPLLSRGREARAGADRGALAAAVAGLAPLSSVPAAAAEAAACRRRLLELARAALEAGAEARGDVEAACVAAGVPLSALYPAKQPRGRPGTPPGPAGRRPPRRRPRSRRRRRRPPRGSSAPGPATSKCAPSSARAGALAERRGRADGARGAAGGGGEGGRVRRASRGAGRGRGRAGAGGGGGVEAAALAAALAQLPPPGIRRFVLESSRALLVFPTPAEAAGALAAGALAGLCEAFGLEARAAAAQADAAAAAAAPPAPAPRAPRAPRSSRRAPLNPAVPLSGPPDSAPQVPFSSEAIAAALRQHAAAASAAARRPLNPAAPPFAPRGAGPNAGHGQPRVHACARPWHAHAACAAARAGLSAREASN
eukprot:tig00021098_g18171.t1